MEKTSGHTFSKDEFETCLKVLKAVAGHPELSLSDALLLKEWAKEVYKKIRNEGRRQRKGFHKHKDQKVLLETVTSKQYLEKQRVSIAVKNEFLATRLTRAQHCYVCREPYDRVHVHYHKLCPACATENYRKRFARTDLTGRTALVTGGRIKIGYETALKFLRDGAKVIVTTRFPVDAQKRYAREKDYQQWKDRLKVYPLDLRNLPALLEFVEQLNRTEPRLDILVNNAAQTVKFPEEYYNDLRLEEQQGSLLPLHELDNLPEGQSEQDSDQKRDVPAQRLLPQMAAALDQFGVKLDLREKNSWLLKLDEIDELELLEVNLVNQIAPFLLNSRLKALLEQSGPGPRFIVNVSSSEGRFSYRHKTIFHPHTNMTKAALNMMTRTSAKDYADSGIYMNSVDVGWVSSPAPHLKSRQQEIQDQIPPLDLVDAAARIYDPVISGLEGKVVFGALLKHYKTVHW